MHSITTRALVLAAAVMCVLSARADLSPATVEKMRAESPEVVVIVVTKVTKGGAIDNEDVKVTYEAKVVRVVRSASGLKEGDNIVIESYIRNPDFRGDPKPGPRPPDLLPVDWSGIAHLKITDTPKTLKIAVFGYSFVKADPQSRPK